MEKYTANPERIIPTLSNTPTPKARMLSFSVSWNPISSGNPPVWYVYIIARFVLQNQKGFPIGSRQTRFIHPDNINLLQMPVYEEDTEAEIEARKKSWQIPIRHFILFSKSGGSPIIDPITKQVYDPEMPTEQEIFDALKTCWDRFELWVAQCIYNLSGEVMEGHKEAEVPLTHLGKPVLDNKNKQIIEKTVEKI